VTRDNNNNKSINLTILLILNKTLPILFLLELSSLLRFSSTSHCGSFDHTHTTRHTRQDPSGRVISPSQKPLPTQNNTTYNKHKRQTSMPSAGFEPAIPTTKRRLRSRGHQDRHVPFYCLKLRAASHNFLITELARVRFEFETPG
jgi:hypothetical protein